MKTQVATSAGGIVFDDAERVLLLKTRSPEGVARWSLPKGALEPGESAEQAAIREVREETGMQAEILAQAGVIDYWFVWKADNTRYHKFVHYFVMRSLYGDFSQRDAEAEDVAWFDQAAALRKCSFRNEREMIRKAVASLRA